MNKKAFTMVELLGVLVILGILSGVSVTAVYKYKEKAQKQAYE